LLFVLSLVLVGCGGQEEASVLKFTAIPDQNTTELEQRFAPFAGHLESVLGVPVEYVPSRDYQASVEMFRNGDIHLAWFGGLTGVQARAAVAGAEAIAQGKADPQYYSYFIAHESTGLERSEDFPADIAGLTFTFGSESSTSGRLMPEHFIRENTGRSPAEFFSQTYGFSGSHDKTVELVEAGRFQAGVVNYKVYERRVAEGQTDPEVVKVIWKTPYYADYNFTAHPELETLFGAGFTKKLQDALVGITDTELLAALPREALIPATSAEFEGIAVVARDLGMVR
jgi:phosphonate transport system substrate-binding protein